MTHRSALIGKSTESGSGSANQTTTTVNGPQQHTVDGQKCSQEVHMSQELGQTQESQVNEKKTNV